MQPGKQKTWVSLANKTNIPGDADGDFNALTPDWMPVQVEPLSPGSSDGRSILHQVTMRFHPQVSLDTRMVYTDPVLGRDRQLFVRGYQNVNGENAWLRLICEEIQP